MSNPYRRDAYQVDILIRGWQSTELTQACLSTIERYTDPELYQITYVDNGTDINRAADLMRQFPNVQFVRLPFNHGSVRGINTGLALAMMSPAPYVLLMDNDTEVPRGDTTWLERWLTFFQDEEVAAAGAVSDYVSGRQNADFMPDTYNKDWQENGRGGVAKPQPVELMVSFALMLRKSAVQAVGLFDELFEPGMSEDYDYTLRLRQAGYKCVVANSVWIKHRGSQTFGRMGFNDLLASSYEKLINKWGVDGLAELGIEVQTREAVTA